jgi:hypothetical protein
MITIFENIYIKDKPVYISVDMALERIRTGAKSKDRILELRSCIDEERQSVLKKNLPCVCFSGEFKTRFDNDLTKHSGYLVLDFDNVSDIGTLAAEISTKDYVYAMWLSPRGNGLKSLIKLADGSKHREHFAALKEIFPDVDNSGINESRVCYESYDPNIYINTNAKPFTKIKTVEKYEAKESLADERKIFDNLLKWLSNKGGTFSKGERNIFIYKLASACCRFGVYEDSAVNMILSEYPASNDFTAKEAHATIKSAYRSNSSKSGTAQFERDILVDKVTRKEVVIDPAVFDESIPPKDIIYAATVKENAMNLYKFGYAKVSGIGVPKVDELHKSKKGELTALTGIGNYGKSTWAKWRKLMRVLLYGEKFVVFCPEDNPPEEYYLDYVEMLLGKNCTPTNFDGTPNLNQPSIEIYNNAYDFIGNHIFYMYPKDDAATLDYILERFLEMVIKNKVDGCEIDPWNQVLHDYAKHGVNVSKYLEHSLGRLGRFAQTNSVYMDLTVHPKQMTKLANGNYECPDVFDINDGAMWNNKVDNILVYHRPLAQTDPRNPLCEFHSKKIRRQKTVGKKGFIECEYKASTRRFEVDGKDWMQELVNRNKLDFHAPIVNFVPAKDEQRTQESSNFHKAFQQRSGYNPADWETN